MNRLKRLLVFAAALGLASAVFLLSGCDEEPVAPPELPSYIEANLIICNPLAPSPGQLTTLTLQAEGFAGGGTAHYEWFAEVGSFYDPDPNDGIPPNAGISVLWMVPNDTTGVFRVGAVATVDGKSDSIVKSIGVRYFDGVDTRLHVNLYPNLAGMNEEVFFVGSDIPPQSLSFIGYDAYQALPAGGAKNLTNCADCDSGDDFVYYSSAILGSMVTRYFGNFRQQLMNVWSVPYFFGTQVDISDDGDIGTNQRRNQHRDPRGNATANMVVWMANIVGESGDGTEDFYNIGFWNNMGTRITLTESLDSTKVVIGPDTVTIYRYYQNIKPTITADERYVVYFVDTTDVFEPCLVPIEGNVANKSKRRALMVDEFNGIFSEADVSVSERTIFQWNPDPAKNLLGFIDGDRNLCFFYADTLPLGNVVKFEELGRIYEFAWSPGGDTCAVVNDDGVAITTLTGIAEQKFYEEKSTDEFVGLNWSTDPNSDDPKLVFRMIRKGKSFNDSYSSVIVYSLINDDWFYATPRVSWDSEPPVDYPWMRIVFKADNSGFYAPIPVGNAGAVGLFYSHE